MALLLGLQFRGLKSLAFATGEVAVLRELRVLVHRTIHPYVNTLRMTAGTSLDSCVVHRWFASPTPWIATASESAYTPSIRSRLVSQPFGHFKRFAAGLPLPPNVLASVYKTFAIFKVLLAVFRFRVGLAPSKRYFQLMIQNPTAVLRNHATNVNLKDFEKALKLSIFTLAISASSKI